MKKTRAALNKKIVDHASVVAELREHAGALAALHKRLKEIENHLYRANRYEWRNAVDVYGEERVVLKGRTKYNAYPRRLTDSFEELQTICAQMGMQPSDLRRVARTLGAKR